MNIYNFLPKVASPTFYYVIRFLYISFTVFITEFLSKTNEIPEEEGTSHVCKAAYNETLAKFHPW